MGKPVFRASPGCELACVACDIRCAILAGEADDAWRTVEHLRRRQALHPAPEQAATLKRAEARLEGAERDFARARPGGSAELPIPAWSRTSGSGLLH